MQKIVVQYVEKLKQLLNVVSTCEYFFLFELEVTVES